MYIYVILVCFFLGLSLTKKAKFPQGTMKIKLRHQQHVFQSTLESLEYHILYWFNHIQRLILKSEDVI